MLRELIAVDRALDLGLRIEIAQAFADRVSSADGDARSDGAGDGDGDGDADGNADGNADGEADALRRIVIDPQNPELAAEAITDLFRQVPYRDDPAWWA